MPTMELTPREIALIEFHRMSPAQQQAERARLKQVAREAALARLSPEKRAAAEQRKADAVAAVEAEKARVAELTPEEREVERAVKQKTSAEAVLARAKPDTVSRVSAALADLSPVEEK